MAVFGAPLVRAGSEQATRVTSLDFDLNYTLNENAQPLDAVTLWYTRDSGETWQEFGGDPDRQPPFRFRAPHEGLYGLYLVARNRTGASSMPPTSATVPHLWVFVDETPPVVQLHSARHTTVLGEPVIQIRWTAVDNHLGSRPVELFYQQVPEQTWRRIADEALPNTGQYDWRLPVGLAGTVAIRVSVTDRGGNRMDSEPRVIDLPAAGSYREPRDVEARAAEENETTDRPLGSIRATERASRLFREARTHRERGEYLEAIGRLREAVKLRPQWTEAFVEMADLLYRVGDLDRALEAYTVALKQNPSMRSALRGAAMVYRRKNDYAAADASLRRILLHDPRDAEIWMNLGDVAIYRGNEALARECYVRATQTDPTAIAIVEEAKKRLELMSEVSRRYDAPPE